MATRKRHTITVIMSTPHKAVNKGLPGREMRTAGANSDCCVVVSTAPQDTKINSGTAISFKIDIGMGSTFPVWSVFISHNSKAIHELHEISQTEAEWPFEAAFCALVR